MNILTARLLIVHTVPSKLWHIQCIRKTCAAAVRLPPPQFQAQAQAQALVLALAVAADAAQDLLAQFLHLHCVRTAVCFGTVPFSSGRPQCVVMLILLLSAAAAISHSPRCASAGDRSQPAEVENGEWRTGSVDLVLSLGKQIN